MSSYLGWTDREPLTRAQSSSIKEKPVFGGPVTNSYENYVKNIFHPMNRLSKDGSQQAADHGLSASSMLKMERSLGRYAIDDSLDSFDDSRMFLKTPLESLYAELGLKNSEHAHYRQFPVYNPKQSSEYFAISHGAERRPDRYSSGGCYSSYREKDDEEYAKNNHKTIIDYKNFDRSGTISRASSPLSPYLYRDHPYVRSQDSRIIGSNFVQVTSRPKDRFLEKVDQTLAEIRASPRYT
ncbi:unnamed protein product [Heligmosomoides polygyrus]|uniref:Uncharacterized protein n=1 Tax=Heligmosomoides polygyrus TaxID=6339 RepID=A0A183GMF8_HELPZ|nr:unnamed protein product [Heligmosomoides polygyrus]